MTMNEDEFEARVRGCWYRGANLRGITETRRLSLFASPSLILMPFRTEAWIIILR